MQIRGGHCARTCTSHRVYVDVVVCLVCRYSLRIAGFSKNDVEVDREKRTADKEMRRSVKQPQRG